MIRAFRIVKQRRSPKAFDGEGARLKGGRWNSPGTAVIYTSQTLSQAILEILVHAEDVDLIMAKYVYFQVEFEESLVEVVDPLKLPEGWADETIDSRNQMMGDAWARETRSAVLRVSSVITAGEFNYLLNPLHADFSQIKIGSAVPLKFDRRLAGSLN